MDAAEDACEQMARERWALRLLARNQNTAQAREAAQRHLDRLGALMKTQMQLATNSKG
jgi:hypothetical protein